MQVRDAFTDKLCGPVIFDVVVQPTPYTLGSDSIFIVLNRDPDIQPDF